MVEGRAPNYKRARTFGCLMACHLAKKKRRGRIPAGHKAEPMVFLGVKDGRVVFGYSFRTLKVHEVMHVRYLESIYPGLTLKPTYLNPLLSLNFTDVPDESEGSDDDKVDVYEPEFEDDFPVALPGSEEDNFHPAGHQGGIRFHGEIEAEDESAGEHLIHVY
jgi:hypothetical protein